MSAFVRASRLYDAQRRECVPWDWAKMQPLAESQAEVDHAVAAVLAEEFAADGGR